MLPMANCIRLLIADDEPLVRRGLRATFASVSGVRIVGEAGNGEAAVATARATAADVALVDINMPVLDGLAVVRELAGKDRDGATKVIILTMYDRDEYVYEALRCGASGFVLKDSPTRVLVEAVRTAASGDALLSPSVTTWLIREFSRRPGRRPGAPGLDRLTEREHAVFDLLVRGHRNEDVARMLGLGAATVKSHTQHLYHKLGVRDRVQAVIYAYEHGLF